ncbi:hypothetical protein B5K11_31350 [Rhizobium leguminosarum bv. trifolii]|nr:hypothetical protein B5K11_31350 [Rhizobium leguminosarum bv. trifolii]
MLASSQHSPTRFFAGQGFSKSGEITISGIWRETLEVRQAFTMLTMEPGPDIAPYHDRQIVVLERKAWADWLNSTVAAKSLVSLLPPGTLSVEQVGRNAPGYGSCRNTRRT